MSLSTAPPPGWYADGCTPYVLRWFDGTRWTEHVTPVGGPPAPPAPDLGPSNALHWVVPVGRSWQSIVAGYTGLFALFLGLLGAAGPVGLMIAGVAGGAAVWIGVLAIRAAATGGHGRGRAWFGIVCGVLCVAIAVTTFLATH
jgi:hypothetical protein